MQSYSESEESDALLMWLRGERPCFISSDDQETDHLLAIGYPGSELIRFHGMPKTVERARDIVGLAIVGRLEWLLDPRVVSSVDLPDKIDARGRGHEITVLSGYIQANLSQFHAADERIGFGSPWWTLLDWFRGGEALPLKEYRPT